MGFAGLKDVIAAGKKDRFTSAQRNKLSSNPASPERTEVKVFVSFLWATPNMRVAFALRESASISRTFFPGSCASTPAIQQAENVFPSFGLALEIRMLFSDRSFCIAKSLVWSTR